VDDRLVRVGYAEVRQPAVSELLAAQPEEFSGHPAGVVFSSVSARGERREARLVAWSASAPA